MDWYLKVLKNYVGFDGRARRKEYWMFTLFNLIIMVALMALQMMATSISEGATMAVSLLLMLYALGVLLPSVAVTIRRLHDIDKSGWWILIAFVPFVGGLILLVFEVMEGTRGDNRFGADPKAGEGGAPAMA